jgi:flavin-dependent dehydrogenase
MPDALSPSKIEQFQLSAVNGKSAVLKLDLGGFGISRFSFDDFLYQKAKLMGVNFLLNTTVDDVSFAENRFTIQLNSTTIEADIVIAAYGKRSKLDVKMDRPFARKKSPYLAIKYHVRTDHPHDLISLHNFNGGYCGINNIENGVSNLCYMVNRNYFQPYGNIQDFENEVLWKNPFLKNIFNNADFIFDKPLTINEISFETKSAVERHMLMVGDTAGMITPLCGNGMAMAIRSGKIAAEIIIQHLNDPTSNRQIMEFRYQKEWKRNFAGRLKFGRQLQRLFGHPVMSNLSVNLAINCRPIAYSMMKSSHGTPF